MLRQALRRLRACLVAALPLALPACVAPCDGGPSTTVGVALQNRLPVMPVEVNGRPVPFVMDTGASLTTLLPEGVAVLGLPVDRLRFSSGVGIAGETRAQNVLLSRMRVGGHDLRNLSVPVAAYSRPGGARVAGLLGADLLRISEVELDMPARRVTLHDGRRCRLAAMPGQGAYDAIPVALVGGGLMVLPVEVNGQPMRALFDTGAEASLLRRSLAPAIGVTEQEVTRLPMGTAHGIGTGGVEVRLLRGVTVRIGAERMAGASLLLGPLPASAPFDLILGQDYIGGRRFWLSYAEQRLYVQRPGGR
ncbi:retropepsin-like aspartic protease [Roseomonas populi]|uniref:Retroviral-like aspartic protease family protein n=1 Tax=Roseomonas populi TaxID=3121582 RepID=A0ABT1X5N5_9PROT|nr:retropepsin-like aspartic protease [Roseomonas pecuniae]MCR0983410.1 retroviral-like aspartic protease family protein [Roseomonas pecuniae]